MPGRLVYRNTTYVVFGLGIDALAVLVAVIDRSPWLATVLAPLLVFGVRWAMMRVVIDGRGVRVVNLWRTHFLPWSKVEAFVSCGRNVERFERSGRVRAFLGLVCLRRIDGGEIVLSATSSSGTMTPSERVIGTWLPGLVARLNAARPRAAAIAPG